MKCGIGSSVCFDCLRCVLGLVYPCRIDCRCSRLLFLPLAPIRAAPTHMLPLAPTLARLASAYAKLIAVEDQRTSIHRTWIREMHSLGEKEPIGFSHFVRWVVAQEPASMHRAWRPYTRMCRFDTVAYTFIGRFETLEQDISRLMQALGMSSERERRVWQRANAETRPLTPNDHPDHLLKLHHLYYSDDERDLVRIVGEKYREDIGLFAYEFPRNNSYAPWENAGAGGLPHR